MSVARRYHWRFQAMRRLGQMTILYQTEGGIWEPVEHRQLDAMIRYWNARSKLTDRELDEMGEDAS